MNSPSGVIWSDRSISVDLNILKNLFIDVSIVLILFHNQFSRRETVGGIHLFYIMK